MVSVTSIDYAHGEHRLVGQLARPDGPARGAVLAMHSGMGLNAQTRARIAALAEEGYLAFAADMYGDGAVYTDPEVARGPFSELHARPDLVRARTALAFDTLRALPDAQGLRIGAIGFCFGGQCVLELARGGAELEAVVSYHGLLTTDQPARPGAVKARVVAFCGAHDPYAPPADIEALRAEMAAAGASLDLTIYSDGWHAFTDPDAADSGSITGLRYDPLLDKLSWASTLALFEGVLQQPAGGSKPQPGPM